VSDIEHNRETHVCGPISINNLPHSQLQTIFRIQIAEFKKYCEGIMIYPI
jgi:hypothetical protein